MIPRLTKAEEQIMQYIWDLGKCCLKDIVGKFPEPRPAYTTISTVVRVLVKKNFIGYKTIGKTNEYYSLISRDDYFKKSLKPMLSNYIKGSVSTVASFFSNEKLSITELEEIRKLIDDRISKLKNQKKNR